MKKSKVELKLESTMAELSKLKNAIISEGREPTDLEKTEIEKLRDRLRNLEEIKKDLLKPRNNINSTSAIYDSK